MKAYKLISAIYRGKDLLARAKWVLGLQGVK